MPKRKIYREPEEERERRVPTTRYRPDYRKGLTSQQVQEHQLHGWTNRAVESASKTTKEIIHENVFTYFNLIFAVLAVLLCIAGSFRDLTFLPVILANTLIGIIQEVRAKQVLDNLSMLNAPRSAVVRDGKKKIVDSEELVLDDIVIFKAGSQVCADAEVCAGEVQVNESLLTGESDEITKRRGDKLMSGSFIVSGQCHARLDKVGEDYDKGTAFLPQLLSAAQAAQAVFEVIRSSIAAKGGVPVKKGKLIVATVQGDIHDIGKNIVKTVLGNYGYEVLDLGREVPPETILRTVQEQGVRLVGLSALMTTTLPAMEKTIRLLHTMEEPPVIFVGGAVVTPEYAKQMNADYYAKDAHQSVEITRKVMG